MANREESERDRGERGVWDMCYVFMCCYCRKKRGCGLRVKAGGDAERRKEWATLDEALAGLVVLRWRRRSCMGTIMRESIPIQFQIMEKKKKKGYI